MPEKLSMVPGGLEEKVFRSSHWSQGSIDFEKYRKNLIAGIVIAVFVLLSVEMIWLQETYLSLMRGVADFNVLGHTGKTLPVDYINGYNLLLVLTCIAAAVVSYMRRIKQSNRHRQQVAKSFILARFFSGELPETENRNIFWKILTDAYFSSNNQMLKSFSKAAYNLDFYLGNRSSPAPSMLIFFLTMLCCGLLYKAFDELVIYSDLLNNDNVEVYAWLARAVILANYIAFSAFMLEVLTRFTNFSILHEHLREIDNGVLEIELPQGIAEAADA